MALSEAGSTSNAFAPTISAAPIARIRARFRMRLLIRAPRQAPVQTAIAQWLAQAPKPPANLRMSVDIDPQSFF